MSATIVRPPKGSLQTLGALLRYVWPADDWTMRARVVLAMVLLGTAKLALVYVPVLYGRAVDALSGTGGAAVVLPLGLVLGYGLARVLSLAFSELRDAVFARAGQRAIRVLALEVFRHLHALSLRYHLERQTGGLTRAIERGNRAIELLLRFSLFNVIPTLLELALVFVILWRTLDLAVAALTLATVAVYIAYTIWVTEWRLKFRREMNEQDSRANTKAIDSLLNFETVKYFGNEAHEASRYDEALAAYESASVKSQQSLAALNIGQATIVSAGLTAVMYLTGRGIVDGTNSVGDFVMANTFLMQLYQPLNFFGFVYREIKQALIDIERMIGLLAEPAEIADPPGAPALALAGGTVRFESVSFGYDPRRSILRDVSFEVPAGSTLAVVGASGAGKSTLSRLLFRFYDVSGGRITIDGQDIREVTQASLRAAIGVVPQDTVLFNDTVYYNIAYGRPSASPSEVEEAARLAHIHDFVMGLPDGYQTRVGERGLKLSGGEKQRVAIARTIVKAPTILVFDEATSALDSNTEREIQRNLRELAAGRTTLVIAHRLSTVVDADQILVLDAGQVVERGRHRELLAHGGRYAALWQRQQRSAEDATGESPSGTPALEG
ncbi:MAG: ABC transporter ATP-binding protein/permease [Ectothiorhodospiraceae bacterium]|nr:ABC transporter ATP-binding protein/permease [Ectothiorhodospiraceae bacterium]